jgi:hypothetical protein
MQCTGYTSFIVDNKVSTAEDFLRLCLHNFGIMAAYRDEPISTEIPDEIPLDDYHSKELVKSRQLLEELKARPDGEWRAYIEKELAAEKDARDRRDRKDAEASARVEAITKAISAWKCSRDFDGIKKFALEQLGITTPDSTQWSDEKISSLTGALSDPAKFEEYKDLYIKSAEESIDYHTKMHAEALERHKSANDFLSRFKKEISNLDK